MKRSLLLLALIACSRREDREAPRPPAGEVWLSRQQLEAQQMRIEVDFLGVMSRLLRRACAANAVATIANGGCALQRLS